MWMIQNQVQGQEIAHMRIYGTKSDPSVNWIRQLLPAQSIQRDKLRVCFINVCKYEKGMIIVPFSRYHSSPHHSLRLFLHPFCPPLL